jgi:hypothetical protein
LLDRHIDGERYKYHSESTNKTIAERNAAQLRLEGEHVRILHGTRKRSQHHHSIVYKVYVRR